MSIGLGVFLSSLFLGCVTLYIFTRDRWNWKKLLLWPSATLALVAVGVYAYNMIPETPKRETSFWEIPLGASEHDVLFIKGEPTNKDDDNWLYMFNDSQGNWERVYYVNLKGGKVWLTGFVGADPVSWQENIQSITMGSSENAVREKFGEPSPGVSTKDGLRRMYHYSQYNVFFQLERNKVTGLGIYDPEVAPNGVMLRNEEPSKK